MILKFGLFFNIKNIDPFCKDELFDLSKYSNLSINFIHEKRSKDEIKPLNNVTGLKKYEGYLFRQKDSFVVYVNNISDNWITNIEFTCAKYGYEGLYIFADDESIYPAYELYYYNGSKKRVIYSMKDGERWVFFQNGPKQDFEMGDLYKERGVTKKFNYEKLKSFCMNLGVHFEERDFLIPTDTIYHTYVK